MSYKTDRVAGEIVKTISVILRDKVHNPNIPLMTTVTSAEVSKDLKYARVYVSVIGDAETAVAALNASAGYIRHELAAAGSAVRRALLVLGAARGAEHRWTPLALPGGSHCIG